MRDIEAFKVWACEGITAGWKFSKCVFGSNMSVKHLKMVLGWKYDVCWRFKFLKIFYHHDLEKLLSKAVEAFKVLASKGITAGKNFQNVFWGLKKVKNMSKSFQNGYISCSGHF